MGMHVIDGINLQVGRILVFTYAINKLECFRFVDIIFVWAATAFMRAVERQYTMNAIAYIYNFLISLRRSTSFAPSPNPAWSFCIKFSHTYANLSMNIFAVFTAGYQHVQLRRVIHINKRPRMKYTHFAILRRWWHWDLVWGRRKTAHSRKTFTFHR